MKSVFYEVGAASAVSHYLLNDNWTTYFDDAPHENKYGWGPLIPASYAEAHPEWEIVLVEPSPSVANELMGWVAKSDRSTLVTCAVGGFAKLNLMQVWDVRYNKDWGKPDSMPINQLHHVSHLVPMDSPVINEFLVPTYTLDDLISAVGKSPTVLRVDIEGAEVEALEAYSFSPAPRMIQVDHHYCNLREVRHILEREGYTIIEEQAYMGGDPNNIIAELPYEEFMERNNL